ncbi:MAG: flagellar biosynthesis protein FlhB [Alphaproteobacteria bacterium]|nr:flagellar biosynthesis protein FlhB [Alphaproteobacteria bacterium]
MSDESDDAEKTEEPTPKKLEESRKKGQVALSRELNNWLMLLTGTLVVLIIGPGVLRRLKEHMAIYIEHAAQLPGAPGGLSQVLGESFVDILVIFFLPLAIFMLVAFLGPFLQIGPLFSAETVKPDISKISPIKGFKRLFSTRSLVEFVKGIFKIAVIGAVGVVVLMPFYGAVEHLVGMHMAQVLYELKMLVARLMTGVLVVLLLIAIADVLYQRYEHYKKMRMSKQELKDEYKQSEGDPHVKARLRQLRRERARARMMQAVPEADVVITNPTHFAVALKYKPQEMNAPVCVAKGQDLIAQKIREIAKEHKIEIVENPPLARSLHKMVEIDQEIPGDLYQAVAEVISYVFRKQGKL